MRTKSFIVAFALGVFLVGTGFILQVARATHETERAIHNRTAQRAELEARLTTAGARLAAAEKDRKDLEQTLQNLRAKPTAAAANAPRSEGSSSASDVQAGSLN